MDVSRNGPSLLQSSLAGDVLDVRWWWRHCPGNTDVSVGRFSILNGTGTKVLFLTLVVRFVAGPCQEQVHVPTHVWTSVILAPVTPALPPFRRLVRVGQPAGGSSARWSLCVRTSATNCCRVVSTTVNKTVITANVENVNLLSIKVHNKPV